MELSSVRSPQHLSGDDLWMGAVEANALTAANRANGVLARGEGPLKAFTALGQVLEGLSPEMAKDVIETLSSGAYEEIFRSLASWTLDDEFFDKAVRPAQFGFETYVHEHVRSFGPGGLIRHLSEVANAVPPGIAVNLVSPLQYVPRYYLHKALQLEFSSLMYKSPAYDSAVEALVRLLEKLDKSPASDSADRVSFLLASEPGYISKYDLDALSEASIRRNSWELAVAEAIEAAVARGMSPQLPRELQCAYQQRSRSSGAVTSSDCKEIPRFGTLNTDDVESAKLVEEAIERGLQKHQAVSGSGAAPR